MNSILVKRIHPGIGLRILLLVLAVFAIARPTEAQSQAGRADGAKAIGTPRGTKAVVLFMIDGLRREEVFGGADRALMSKGPGVVGAVDAQTSATFWRETAHGRREALMPFFWETVAKRGQIFGNHERGSISHVTNDFRVSYPGYNEVLCGYPDPRIMNNAKKANSNITVFEWLNGKEAYRGRVAAFAAWDVFPYIFNRERCGFPVNAGFEPLLLEPMTPTLALLNRLKVETPSPWSGEPFDSFTFHTAMEYLRTRKPRVLFLGLGEVDEWGHKGDYANYLKSTRRSDAYLRELWETLQSMPEYAGQTSVIISPDHGRGGAPVEWKNHGSKPAQAGSEFTWLAVLGPDTAPQGEREGCEPVTQAQVAATVAALLGEDYTAAQPRAAKPIEDVLGR